MKSATCTALGLAITLLLLLTSCLGSSEVKIGVIIPQEGSSLQEYGYQITSGIQLALEDLRQEGKLKKKYTLILRNEDQNDTESIKKTFLDLEKEGVIAVIGTASSAGMLALTPLANETHTVLLSPAASSPEINTGNTDFVFRNQPSDTLEAQLLSNVIFQKCRFQKLLMVRSRSAFGEGITLDLLRFGRQNSKEIPNVVVKFDPDHTKVDWVAVVDQIVDVDPQAVFLAAYTSELIPLISEIRSRDELSKLYIFTCSSFLPEQAITKIGKEALEGVIFTAYPWDPTEITPHIQRFAQRFEENFHAKPDIYAANGYDAMIFLVRAIENSRHWIRDEVRDELNKLSLKPSEDLILRETDFNKRGDVTRIPAIYRVESGIPVMLTPEEMEKIKRDVLTSF